MAFYRPGDTVRLSGPWGFVSSGPPSAIWSIGSSNAYTGGPESSYNNLAGWVVTKVAGEWGDNSLVVDITIPQNAPSLREYRKYFYFIHQGVIRQNAFQVDYEEVQQPSFHPYEFVRSPQGQYYAASLSGSGLHIYSITPGLEFFEELSVHEDLYCPALTFDEAGTMYLLAAKRALSLDKHTVELYRSNDGGRTLEHVSRFHAGRPNLMFLRYYRYGALITFYLRADSIDPSVNYSGDYGVTWENQPVTAGRNYYNMLDGHYFTWYNASGAIRNLKENVVLLGSWQIRDESNALTGTQDLNQVVFDVRTRAMLGMFVRSGKILCSRMKQLTPRPPTSTGIPRYGVEAEAATRITFFNASKHSSLSGALILVHNPRSGRIIAGNGRLDNYADYHFSDDLGRTWLAKVPVEQ